VRAHVRALIVEEFDLSPFIHPVGSRARTSLL
jgi:hypothetical protein